VIYITTRKQHNLALVELLAGTVLISFSAVFVKLADVPPTIAGVYRMLFGGLILLAISLLKRQRLWGGRLSFVLILSAGLAFAVDLSFWHRSIHYIGPGLSTILANFQVLLVTAFGILILKEKARFSALLAIPLALTGLFLIFGWEWGQLDANYKLGVAFGLATACAYSVYILLLRRLQREENRLSPLANITLISLICTLFLIAEALIEGESFVIPDRQSWVSLISYGLFGQVLGWVLIGRAMTHLETSRVAIVLLLQPALAFLWDVFFFSRATSATEYLGVTLALTAIYLGARRQMS